MPTKSTDEKIDELALSIGRGFEEVHRQIDDVRGELQGELQQVRADVRDVITRLDRIELQTSGLSGRVEVLEDTIRVIKTKLQMG